MRLIALIAAAAFSLDAGGRTCSAESGPHATALVELYTSEGCNSCPPADRWLSSLAGSGLVPGKVVPIALHVDYWDYIGWKDPYARREFTLRQQLHAQIRRARLVYTPQVLLQGQDFRAWGTPAFGEAVARINALPAAARIAMSLDTGRRDAFAVEVSAEVLDAAQRPDAALYVATYENKLLSRVLAGENRGRILAHDFVVLEWQGPIAFRGAARLSERRTLPLLPRAVPAHSGVVGFVQNRATAEVLQALMLPACPG
jgi:hypothetical protein